MTVAAVERSSPWRVAADILDPPDDDNRRPKQHPPEGDWRVWLLHPGRGWGKGYAAAHYLRDQVRSGRSSKIGLVGSTVRHVRQVMIEDSDSGLLAVCPDAIYRRSDAEVVWPNGARAYIVSAEKPDRVRGMNIDTAWADEVDSWGQETTNEKARDAWENLELAVRKGAARMVVTSTPKPGRMVSQLLEQAAKDDSVRVTTGSTYENAENLSDAFVEAIERRYKGTRLERQEIYGEVLDAIHGALWTPSSFQHDDFEPEDVSRVVVGVDPSGGGDMIGIVAVGKIVGESDHLAVLDDWTLHGSPSTWARRTLELVQEWGADCIAAERNFGGDMVESTIRQQDRNAPVKMVTASRGKHIRAEPLSLLYEQEKVWHRRGAQLDLLEEQMRHMTTQGYVGEDSPDRVDALVWACNELTTGPQPIRTLKARWG